MGNLFSEGVSPSDIESMRYDQLDYWNGWYLKIEEARKKAIDEAKRK